MYVLDLSVRVPPRVTAPVTYTPMAVDAINQVADGRQRGKRVTISCNSPLFLTAGGVSEPDVIIGSDRDLNRRCRKKDKDHILFLCELCEAQVARGRYFVHELTSEVNSRVRCMAKVMAMPGIRTAVAELCMFRLAACDEGGPGFVNVSVRTITNTRRVGVRLQSKCGSMHRQAQVNADNTIETRERTGSWVRQVAQEIGENL